LATVLRSLARVSRGSATPLTDGGVDQLVSAALPPGGWSAGKSGLLSTEFTSLALLALAEAGETHWIHAPSAKAELLELHERVHALEGTLSRQEQDVVILAEKRCGNLQRERERLAAENNALLQQLDRTQAELERIEQRSIDERSVESNERRRLDELASELEATTRSIQRVITRSGPQRWMMLGSLAVLLALAAVILRLGLYTSPTNILMFLGLGLVACSFLYVLYVDRRFMNLVASVRQRGGLPPGRVELSSQIDDPRLEYARRQWIRIGRSVPTSVQSEIYIRLSREWGELPPSLLRRRAESLVATLPLDTDDASQVFEWLDLFSHLSLVERSLLLDQIANLPGSSTDPGKR